MKAKQLSLFGDADVEKSALVYAYFKPTKAMARMFRFEILYNIVPFWHLPADITIWNLMRHRNGKGRVKIGRRYFYDKAETETRLSEAHGYRTL